MCRLMESALHKALYIVAELAVVLPHDIDLRPDPLYGEWQKIPTRALEYGLPRCQEVPPEFLGFIAIVDEEAERKHPVPVYEVTYGGLENPPPEIPDTYFVVSALTCAAAFRDPAYAALAERMLVPFKNIYENGRVVAVEAFARPIPVARYRCEELPDERTFSRVLSKIALQNTCPYPFRIFDQDAPGVVPDGYEAMLEFDAAEADRQLTLSYAEPEHNKALSDQLGVPVFDTEVIGVTPRQPLEDEAYQLCHITVPHAMPDPSGHFVAHDLVRDSNGTMIGGRSLARINPIDLNGFVL